MSFDGQQFDVYVGEAKTLQFTEVNAVVVTGWTISWRLTKTPGGTPLLTKSAASGSPTTTQYTVSLSKSDTQTLSPGIYYWDSTRDDLGFEEVLATGLVSLKQRITSAG